MVTDGDEPLPSLSDWHDYEPNLEFDDTELTHPATTNGKQWKQTFPLLKFFDFLIDEIMNDDES